MHHPLLEALAVVAVLGAAVFVAACVWACVIARRHWLALRARMARIPRIPQTQARDIWEELRLGLAGSDPSVRGPLHERRKLVRALQAAERAVVQASDAGAPVGDLRAMCRHLRESAAGVERLLRAAAPGSAAYREAVGQADAITEAAGQMTEAASASLRAFIHPDVVWVTDAARREAIAVREGVAPR